jgi:hypothetical protein
MKRFFITCLILSTVFFTFTVDAQEGSFLRKPSNVTLPEKIQGPLGDPIPAGTYSIGTGGYFPTIDSAFNKLSTDGVAGNVTLELIDNLYIAPTTQFGFLLNGSIPGAGPTSRVTIKPAENKNVTIQGDREAVLYLVNTSYVKFDGIDIAGPTTLTIHALQNSSYTYNECLVFMNNSDHNIVQNIIIICDDYTRPSGGIGLWRTSGTLACDSNLVQNNFIKKAGLGIYISAGGSMTSRPYHNIIRGNIIGSEQDSLIFLGIDLEECHNTIVENNIITRIKGNPAWHTATGILSYLGEGCIIRNNIVHNVSFNALQGSAGIFLDGEANNKGKNISVYNNMIYDIRSTSTAVNGRVSGIRLDNQDFPNIYYNSIYLSGTGANQAGSAPLYIDKGVTNAVVKNNILVNTRDESPYSASAIYDYTLGNLTSDYNDLYYDDTNTNNCLVRIASIKYNSLSAWQATGKDFHSVSVMPCFSGSNLHIDVTEATCLESRGTPIPGFDTDFDGEPRHQYLPDIGADEFDGLRPSGALTYGAYSVGTHGFFTSIESVFDRLSSDGLDAAVTLELIDELYVAPAVQFGFQLNGPIPGAGPNSRVIIKPAENKNVTIQHNGRTTLYLANTSYVTFDGVDITGPTTLTIHTLKNSAYTYNDGLVFMNNSDHNVIQNVIIINDDNTRQSGSGFDCPSSNVAPDSNIIQNNFVKKAGLSFYILKYSGSVKAKGNIFRGNHIGSETDSLIANGIYFALCENTIIENNIIQNLKTQLLDAHREQIGIIAIMGEGDIIRNNIIFNFRATQGFTGSGILLYGSTSILGNDNIAYNNMIYDIQSSSTQADSRVAGIQVQYQNNPKIYYNSVYLEGAGANKLGSAGLYLSSHVTNADIKNNIFINTRDESPYCASAIYDYGSANLTSDYNDLFYDNTNNNNCLVKVGGTNYNTLADWQATGKDLHSYVEMPHFIEPYLEIDPTIPTYLESRGTPIAGIETDYNGDPRNVTTPDIGADEFDGIVGVEDEEALPTEYTLEQNYPNPFNPTTTFRYSIPQTSKVVIKVYDILGNEIAVLMDEEKTVGIYELTWDASSLPSGVYFYQLRAGEYVNTKKMLLIK